MHTGAEINMFLQVPLIELERKNTLKINLLPQIRNQLDTLMELLFQKMMIHGINKNENKK